MKTARSNAEFARQRCKITKKPAVTFLAQSESNYTTACQALRHP